jgi:hypothetical protein
MDERKRQRNIAAEQEAEQIQLNSHIRRGKLATMLEAHDLSLEDLEAFVREVRT